MKQNIFETLMGAIVLAIAIAFFVFAYRSADLHPTNHMVEIHAKFEQADGLEVGSAVRMGGIKIGEVTNQAIDPKTYLALITMQVREDLPIPVDSTAKIVSSGLLGSKYVSLVPGAEDSMLKEQGILTYTQSSVNFESLLAKFIFSKKDENASTSGASQ